MRALSKSEIQLLEFMKHTGLSASESAWVLTGSVSEQGLPNRTLHIVGTGDRWPRRVR